MLANSCASGDGRPGSREGLRRRWRRDSAQVVLMARTDSANTTWLKTYVARWGWPTAEQVGRENVESAFISCNMQSTTRIHASDASGY